MNQNKKKLSVKAKIIIAVLCVLVAGIVAVAILIGTHNTSFSSKAYYYVLMPHKIESEVESQTLKMGVVLSKNHTAKEIDENPLLAYEYYYYDENGEKHELDSLETFEFAGEEVDPQIVFSLAVLKRAKTISKVIKKTIPVLIIVFIGFLIYLWYKSWCRREDLKKELKYKNNNNNKKK